MLETVNANLVNAIRGKALEIRNQLVTVPNAADLANTPLGTFETPSSSLIFREGVAYNELGVTEKNPLSNINRQLQIADFALSDKAIRLKCKTTELFDNIKPLVIELLKDGGITYNNDTNDSCIALIRNASGVLRTAYANSALLILANTLVGTVQ